jgi:hypothetical protein
MFECKQKICIIHTLNFNKGRFMCKITFPIICAVIFAVVATTSQYFVWHILFNSVVTDEAFDGLWRPMNDPIWQYGMPFANFVYGLAFYCAYSLLSPGFTWCKVKFLKGVKFGLIIWLFMGLAGGLMWFVVHPINEAIMFAAMLDHLISLTIGGGIISLLFDKCCGKSCHKTEEELKTTLM